MAQGSSAALSCEPITTLGPLTPPNPPQGLSIPALPDQSWQKASSLDPSA